MKRVLLTGMSGTGKSTLVRELAAMGFKAIDVDNDEWSECRHISGKEPEWVWREDRIQRLLSTEDTDILIVSGCASNQVKFHAQFDQIVLLTAPGEVMLDRLATRTNNPYGQSPDERAAVLANKETVEPLLRNVAGIELDTTLPLDQVVERVLRLVRELPR
jgi:shikimate kinase